MNERAEAAARRLGAPSCQQCKRLGVTEHITVFGNPISRDTYVGRRFYIGYDFCPACAAKFNEQTAQLDGLIELVKDVETLQDLSKLTCQAA